MMNTKKRRSRRPAATNRRRSRFEILERRNLLATVSTDFEGINSNDFTIGMGNETARFASDIDGNAFSGRIGVGHLYRSGVRAWMVMDNASGFIQFSTPADSASLYARLRNNASTGSLVITALDVNGQTLGSDTITSSSAPFTEFTYAGMIDRITFTNTTDQMISVDDFTSSVTAPTGNAKPTFTASNPPAVLEDSSAQTENGFATFDPGNASESGQSVLVYSVSNVSNPRLFSVAPSIDTSGNLTYTPAPDAFGTSTFEVTVQDDGGTANGGIDTSDPQTFTITVTDVNDEPSFTSLVNITVPEDSGPRTIDGFVGSFDPGTGEGSSSDSQNIHSEGNTGVTNPLSTDNNNPTDVGSLALGSNLIQGFVDSALSVGDVDVFTFTIPDGLQLDGLFVLDYQYITAPSNPGERNAFLAINTGNTFPYNAQQLGNNNLDESQFIGGTVFGLDDLPEQPNSTGTNILGRAGLIAGSGFSPPLGAGTYTFYVQQTGPANIYTLDLQVSVAGAQVAEAYLINNLTNPTLFSAAPEVDTDGTLTFTPAENAAGTAIFDLAVRDSGGTANGGVDTSTTRQVTITVTGANDAPTFIATDPPAVVEDSANNVSTAFVTFSSTGPADESNQTILGYSVTGISNPALFSVEPAVDASGNLTYSVPDDVFGTSTFEVTVQDDGGTENGGVDTSVPQTFTITVSSVNDAPTFTIDENVVVNEDSGSQTISRFVDNFDAGPMEDGQSSDSRILHDEREGGGSNPLSTDNTQPTDVGPLSHGSNLVKGIVQSALTIGNVDVFTFTVDSGFQLDGLFVLEYEYATPPNANERNAFLAIDDTDSFPFDAQDLSNNNLDETQFIGGTVFGLDDLPDAGGGNILPRAGNVTGSRFSGPLPAGTYTVYVQQTGPANSYTLDFRVSETGGQSVAEYSISNISDLTLFETLPAIDNQGNLTFESASDVSGTTTFDVFVRDTGGTMNGGQDTSSTIEATITINPVNDAPSFSAGDPPTILANSQPQTIPSFATAFNPGPADESTQTLASYSLTNISNPGLFEESPAIDANGNLTYTPAADAFGTSTFDLAIQDSGGTENGGIDTSQIQSFTITVLEALSVSWTTPEDIIVGTLLSSGQLNATANVSGSFVYTPDVGAELSAGDAQTLSVTFTADDPIYPPTTQTVLINVLDPPIQEDFGDAPSTYPVIRADNGARHIVGDLFLGATVDPELDGQPSDEADGDGNQDDGVSFISNLLVVSGLDSTSSATIIASQSGLLDAWIDFNGDGDWQDIGEQIIASHSVNAGSNVVSFTIPSASNTGNTAARFRLSSVGQLEPRGGASDGEVEDYLVEILDGFNTPPVRVDLVEGDSTVVVENGQVVVRSAAGDLFRATSDNTGTADVVTTESDSTVTLNLAGGTPTNGLNLVGGTGNNVLQILGGGTELDLTSTGNVAVENFAIIDLSDAASNGVKIDVSVVRRFAPSTNSIEIISADGDEISFADFADWRMGDPTIIGNRFIVPVNHVDGDTVESETAHAWQNVVQVSDVNNSGDVTAGDALRIINELGRREFSDAETQDLTNPIDVADWPGVYFDQSGDNRATALDALRVINELARITLAGTGETEQFDFAIAQLLTELENSGDVRTHDSILPTQVKKLATFESSEHRTANTIELVEVDSFFESQANEDQPLLEI